VFDVSVSKFCRSNKLENELNLPILEKIKMIDTLAKDEQQAIFKMINLAISNKKLKENLQKLITIKKATGSFTTNGFFISYLLTPAQLQVIIHCNGPTARPTRAKDTATANTATATRAKALTIM
jgi:hypothetical protein